MELPFAVEHHGSAPWHHSQNVGVPASVAPPNATNGGTSKVKLSSSGSSCSSSSSSSSLVLACSSELITNPHELTRQQTTASVGTLGSTGLSSQVETGPLMRLTSYSSRDHPHGVATVGNISNPFAANAAPTFHMPLQHSSSISAARTTTTTTATTMTANGSTGSSSASVTKFFSQWTQAAAAAVGGPPTVAPSPHKTAAASNIDIGGPIRHTDKPIHTRSEFNSKQLAPQATEDEMTDFTYINVDEGLAMGEDADEDEVDIVVSEGGPESWYHHHNHTHRSSHGPTSLDKANSNQQQKQQFDSTNSAAHDILTILLSGRLGSDGSGANVGAEESTNAADAALHDCLVRANAAVAAAAQAKQIGDLILARDHHGMAAQQFHQAARAVQHSQSQRQQPSIEGDGGNHHQTPLESSPATTLAPTLLQLSQAQAKAALAVQRVLCTATTKLSSSSSTATMTAFATKRLFAASKASHRSADAISGKQLVNNHNMKHHGSNNPLAKNAAGTVNINNHTTTSAGTQPEHSTERNPVDDMMELERVLRNMDMAVDMGQSIASLAGMAPNKLASSFMSRSPPGSTIDGSFMVIPSSNNNNNNNHNVFSASTSSIIWNMPTATTPSAAASARSNNVQTTTTGRARANRVQNIREASSVMSRSHHPPIVAAATTATAKQPTSAVTSHTKMTSAVGASSGGLESSWWGHASTTMGASQVLSSSVISLATSTMVLPGESPTPELLAPPSATAAPPSPAYTKQLMRLMDSLKTLGDENAALLREVQQAEVARQQAKAAKVEMDRFKQEYTQRFAALKTALDHFIQRYPTMVTSDGGNSNNNSTKNTKNENVAVETSFINKLVVDNESNPVAGSAFFRNAALQAQLQRQEQLIQKLTSDLSQVKEENKRKQSALRKYESFYREVKARSAQKAAQRQKQEEGQQQQQQQQQQPSQHHQQQNQLQQRLKPTQPKLVQQQQHKLPHRQQPS